MTTRNGKKAAQLKQLKRQTEAEIAFSHPLLDWKLSTNAWWE